MKLGSRNRILLLPIALIVAAMAWAVTRVEAASVSTAGGGGWSGPITLAGVGRASFDRALAVNRFGDALVAWTTGKPARAFSASRDSVGRISSGTSPGVRLVLSRGTVRRGFGTPIVIARGRSGGLGTVKTALSGSGVAYVAWLGGQWMIATARTRRFTVRPLGLPRGGQLARLTYGLDGPVDAFWYRLNASENHVLGFYCTRLRANGTLGRTFFVFHHNYPNPCRLPATQGLYGTVSTPRRWTPHGYSVEPETVVTRTDGRGGAIVLWQDYGPIGHGSYGTTGMFAEIHSDHGS